MPRKRRPRRSRGRKQTKVFGGVVHLFDRVYGTKRGAERRAKELPSGVAHIHKRPNIEVWETWLSTGRRK